MPSVVPGVADKRAEADRAALKAKAHRQKAASLAMLLRTCETNLNKLKGTDRTHNYIEKALAERDIKERGTSVGLAVMVKWIEGHLAKDGVVIPNRKMFAPEPTTRAATATAPAK